MAQRVAMVGDAEVGFTGFLNNPNVATGSVVNPGSGTECVNKTPLQILNDVNNALSDINADSETVESADTLGLPAKQWDYIAGTPRSENSDTTIMQYIVANSPYINSASDIVKIKELKGAGAGGTDRMIPYTKNIDKIVYHIPMPLRFAQPQAKGLGFEVPGEFKLGGFEIRFPGSLSYNDGI